VNPLKAKEDALLKFLGAQGSLIVAYSGGVDSSYLAYAANRALGKRMLAVTAHSPSYPRGHREMAVEVVRRFDLEHRFVNTQETDNPDYASNPSNRCYFCKSELFEVLERLRDELGYHAVAYGINTDDTRDFRPGHQAAEEHRVLSPFLEVGLSKGEVRELSRACDLPTADLPASACLSSRIPYGMQVTPDKLRQIDRAEDALRELGYRQVRVRHHGDLARIELAKDELPRALELGELQRMSRALHDLGFRWVSLDLDGYRTGSLNEILTPLARRASEEYL
jgi:uncharacterized protein